MIKNKVKKIKVEIVKYPNIDRWIQDGTIEIGFEYGRGIVARAIDEGGTTWEGDNLKNFETAMKALEKGIKKWCDENY
ncbi:MAG: hypothetical protein A3J83_04165 [Elusimicrobia bacterium RIFOXYA2_FULL_40_6]|nr:MAG: hypothetical protein A3J83_04165 [Elusimicrobia bacterium RIFOXYA2_FULL_40_6]